MNIDSQESVIEDNILVYTNRRIKMIPLVVLCVRKIQYIESIYM